MRLFRSITPASRVSLGLAFLTTTLLLLADFVGLIPDRLQGLVDDRLHITEAVALQFSAAVEEDHPEDALAFVREMIKRSPDLLSVGLRGADGGLIVASAGHDDAWAPIDSLTSTPTQMQIPIYRGNTQAGVVEARFSLPPAGRFLTPGMRLVLFAGLAGFIVYRFYLRKVLKHLDPSAVIPRRVKAVLDTMSEGVLVLDNRGQIVLANDSFGRLGSAKAGWIGRKATSLDWVDPSTDERVHVHPWTETAVTGEPQRGVGLSLVDQSGQKRIFTVNASPILGPEGKQRGLIATFDDVTGVEEKNFQLERAMRQLEQSRHEVARQNSELLEQQQALQSEIVQRTRAQAESERLHRELERASHRAGMAEVATSVLHNVGNVLNSANVSANMIDKRVRGSRVSGLVKASELMAEHRDELGSFMTQDPRGQKVPEYLAGLTDHLLQEQDWLLSEADSLRQNIEHIKQVVRMQQSYASIGEHTQEVDVLGIIDEAIDLIRADASTRDMEIERRGDEVPPIFSDKHKILQILVNLLRNGCEAVSEGGGEKRITVIASCVGPDRVKVEVIDTGVGITAEHLDRMFTHGFTTKKTGHGFGLHGAANAAREMGGVLTAHSDGAGRGATFTLELPVRDRKEEDHGRIQNEVESARPAD